jgi:polyferredoxin/tetratricopeptide (TPR) repeat protein
MSKQPSNCSSGGASSGAAVSLPVLAGGANSPIKRSRTSGKRAIVLVTVQLLMVAHVVLWLVSRETGWFGGATLAPVEPSDSMEFVKHGVINAGLVFFVLALLSTLILGRWFCGWGCHLVMMQDFCGWVMKKLGVRPKPFRSRLLLYVPLVLAVYMFLWPAAYRVAVVPLDGALARQFGGPPHQDAAHWVVRAYRGAFGLAGIDLPPEHAGVVGDLPPWQISNHLTTTEFWRSFPGIVVAIPFLGICGFATVYFLGAKGFCTYGCPYGGFFAPLDKLAPARIVVNDACEHCGHCTAVCTSNVRVHEEVREYGMVVDPGCMKCLDCVSVCPNDALSFGFARPAVRKGPPKNAPVARRSDLTWSQEIAILVVFVASFFSVRMVYGLVPMLMAVGFAGCATFMAWMLWRLVREPNVSFHRRRLKYRGAMTRAGVGFAATALLVMAFTIQSGVVRASYAAAQRSDDLVTIPAAVVFSGSPPQVPAEMREAADRALRGYRLASGIGSGGIGLPAPWQADIDMRRAWLHAVCLEFEEAETLVRDVLDRDGYSDRFAVSLVMILRGQGRDDEALAYGEPLVIEQLDASRMLEAVVPLAGELGGFERAIGLCSRRLDRHADDVPTLRWLTVLYFEVGDRDAAIDVLERTIVVDPTMLAAYEALARAHAQSGRLQDAEAALRRGIAAVPNAASLHGILGDLLQSLGRTEEAALQRAEAQRLLGQ